MLETSARLLKLLSLLQAHREWSGGDLADRLGVTPRTVRRDVDKLRELGYPVNSSTGVTGGYQLGPGAKMPPLLLDDEEAVAVAVGLRRAAGGGVTGIEETSLRALAKLEQVLPGRLRRRVSALSAFTVPMLGYGAAGEATGVDAEVLTELAAACRDSETLRFDYAPAGGGEPTRRVVEPHRLVCSRNRWYLVAWDTGRADWRTFRADRITPKPPHGPRFTPREPPAQDLAAYVSEGVAVRVYPERAVVLLHAPIAEVRQRISPSAGVLQEVDADTCLLTTGSYSLEAMAFHVVMTGFDFEVREPAELLDHIGRLRERLDRALTSGSGRVRGA
ncbi:YafY family transcriptional regulator [Streptomyces sp. A7024]|uniref:YafY family transcriptional regulator n=1 Tax=Streptomyces coryli TaxID=1128680 RepID=A0A6G4U5P8_9ACTN|nr:YafY family protein [Streptomyces coryli]NGN67332.1 YafY family transcriptional regulator [Streptomyces coryli]